ncbi:type III-A CRISPR-associated RAMP protein Csm3 [Jingyaoa shaoxingensis]|uniref:CRISPR system Cms endoribonuclease Csm3 n=1 Tax=Jingyaoa shaoxingensis TaxID=2763671 RepID=A0ABR7N647_9FIRM|nr:type III-A CRISPR-associated RAMP protein Csm3 [Jingyaoa shaoxingensis]MBC8571877.1 type III-A CRISPR-associated RAMP protein Csm3 [Jingyaoa shaoxingensis]
MYAKIQITGDLEVKTGMHIGGSSAFAAIGAVDSSVIKDVRTNLPMIPGSSLKGKMRSLLAKEFNERVVSPDDDDIRLTRLFGSAKKGSVKPSRIQISDMIMVNDQELREKGLQSMTEVKFENSINRATAVATPRQIERVVRGSIFELDIIYEVENIEELLEDMETIGEGMKLLQYDYLGGSGSRGYGKVGFSHLYADVVIGDIEESVMEKCNEILQNAVEN